MIDNCVVLLVNVYAVFIVHGGLTLITLKNKQTTLPLWILEEHLSVLSYATSILVWKSALIIWPWDGYQLTGPNSNFFRNVIKISQFLIHFGFSPQTRKKEFPIVLRILWKKKNLPIKPLGVHANGTVMVCLYYYVFVISYYIFKMFY